ncbi:PIN-like domain-containing protein [Nocardia sp. NPDC002869]|uniref:PIN-like domain-containing protein n=1 Tax=Nocardia sp. NPDC002869 TaxID=3161032 RepID=UPI00398D203C
MGRNLTDGFGHFYRPEPEDVRHAFEHGLIVLDTNVLLNVLRYSSIAREELLGVIESIGERCFVPHQVALEYNRNRVGVVAARHKELEEASADVDEIRGKLRGLVGRIRDRRMVSMEVSQHLEASVDGVISEFRDATSRAMEQYDLAAPNMVGQVDEWTKRLSTALDGRVADAPTDDIRQADAKEAKRRREEKLAPGFRDEAGGDYLWWAEVLREPTLKDRPLLVVSDDVAKGDWVFEQHGLRVGPHEILIDDVINAGGSGVWLATTRDLLKLAEESGLSDVSDATLAESEKLLGESRPEWTLDAYVALITTLESEGYESRVRVIREAAARSGFLGRSAVYAIAGLDEEDRSLRQFATPVRRASTQLSLAGIVESTTPDALEAQYDGPGKAKGYSVPTEFTDFEPLLREAEEFIAAEATLDWHVRDQGRAHLRSGLKRILLAHDDTEGAAHIADRLLARAEPSHREGA